MTDKITSIHGFKTQDPKLIAFHETRDNPKKVICIKENPGDTFIDHHRFKIGDIVEINGLVGYSFGKFEVSITSVCGFYDAEAFELV